MKASNIPKTLPSPHGTNVTSLSSLPLCHVSQMSICMYSVCMYSNVHVCIKCSVFVHPMIHPYYV